MFSDLENIHVQTLAQFGRGEDWRLHLAHDCASHLLVWITRGQGRVLLDGMRRGIGAHNALFIPAGTLHAMEVGRQSAGHVVIIPAATPLNLPIIPRQLRIRDVQVQSELTNLIEAAFREDQGNRPLRQDAVQGQCSLISVWLRRQVMQDEHMPAQRNAAQRLSQRFCALLPENFRSGDPMADYAATLGVTPTHLTRAVKSATGKTAADLLCERVLHEARRLLLETKEPAKRIAQHLGFGSAAYFTRFVQHHTGHPPSRLRGN